MSPAATDQHGLLTLSVGATTLLRRLDALVERWAVGTGAASVIMPPLLPVAGLARLDFYTNFPHHALVVSSLDLARVSPAQDRTTFPPELLAPAELGLPSAACFAVYLQHEHQELTADTTVTVLGRCFRREERYEGLRRLLGFHMREVVALGSRDFTLAHLRAAERWILDLAGALDLPMQKQAASDPFYDQGGQRALLARLAPVKHEFVVDELAIASVNVHRNFFGERCDITMGEPPVPVHTSCVAFGLERWLSVLLTRYGDWDAAIEAVRQVEEMADDRPGNR